MKMNNNNDKLSKKLPKRWQLQTWNTFFNVENSTLLHEARPKVFGKAVKTEITKGYYTYCEIKHCFSCTKDKEAEMVAMKKYWDQLENKEQLSTNHSQKGEENTQDG